MSIVKKSGHTSLHFVVDSSVSETNNEIDEDTFVTKVDLLIKYGGAEILTQRTNKGMTPLESIFTEETDEDE